MKRLTKILIYLAVIVAGWLLFMRCSPQARLNALIKNHPELAKTDTVYKTITITIPGINADTTFNQSTNTQALDSVIALYKTKIDTVILKKLQTQLQKIYITRPCLSGPIKFTFSNNGYAILTQANGQFKLTINIKPTVINKQVPFAVTKYQVAQTGTWRYFSIGLIIGFVAAFILFIKLKEGSAK